MASRWRGAYWGRVLTALVALVIWLCASVFEPASSGSTSGAWLFGVLSVFAFGYALMAGLRSTSDCLSREKREGTLGLLFLTDLKGYDVVLGKLAATSLGAFYGMLAVLPVLAIPLLTGGVTAGTFWRVALVLLNTLFFSLACGIFVSAISKNERKALGGTLLLILLLTGGPPLAAFATSAFGGNFPLAQTLFLPSPGLALLLALNPKAAAVWGSTGFSMSAALTHLLSWTLLGLSSWLAPRVWKDKPATIKRLRWRERWRNLILGDAARRRAFRSRLLAINPIFWLSSRERQTVFYPWIFLGSMAAIWLWAWGLDRQLWSELELALFLTYLLHLFIKVWVLTVACQSLALDRDNGALELLFSTPLTVRELLRGHWLNLRRHFAAPVAAIICLDLLWLGLSLAGKRPVSDSFPSEAWMLAFAANIVIFVIDLFALAWVGMWMGVSSKKAGQAAWETVARVLVLPWLLFTPFSIALALFHYGQVVRIWLFRLYPLDPALLILLWLLIGLIVDFIFARAAHGKLHRELRLAATQRFSTDPSRWWQAKTQPARTDLAQ